jgi:GntR family transcriptional regulator, transcriptional repressor for pyruvate dehydrogenase complex
MTTPFESGATSALRRPRQRTNVANEITEYLRRQIVSGNLTRGGRLPSERDLAAYFDVSQPTIREAVRALDAMGLVRVRHGSGTFVIGDSRNFLSQSLHTMLQLEEVGFGEILEVRRAIGVLTATLAAERATNAELTTIAELQEACEQFVGEEPVEYTEHYLEFIDATATATHNPLIRALEMSFSRLLMQFQLRAFADKPIEFWKSRRGPLHEARSKLVAALMARDREGTREASERYYEMLAEITNRDPGLSELRMSDPDIMDALGIRPGS